MLPATAARGTTSTALTYPVPIERTVGLLLEVTAVFLIVILVRELVGSVRRRQNLEPNQISARGWAIGWRVAAIAFLLLFIGCESSVLRIDFASEAVIRWPELGWDYRLRQGLVPICALLAMLGIALGMGAGTLLAGPSESRRRPYWLFVPLAGLVCLLIVAEHYGTLIANLVLVAIEAVTNAMPHRLLRGPGLRDRLLRVRMDAAAAAAVCLALALAVSRDFECTRRNEPWATSRMGRFLRFLLLVTTAVPESISPA